MSCLFCSIVAGEIPSKQIYADEAAIAFLDINPWHVGHALVVPRRHLDDLLGEPEVLSEVAPAIAATSRLLGGASAQRTPEGASFWTRAITSFISRWSSPTRWKVGQPWIWGSRFALASWPTARRPI